MIGLRCENEGLALARPLTVHFGRLTFWRVWGRFVGLEVVGISEISRRQGVNTADGGFRPASCLRGVRPMIGPR